MSHFLILYSFNDFNSLAFTVYIGRTMLFCVTARRSLQLKLFVSFSPHSDLFSNSTEFNHDEDGEKLVRSGGTKLLAYTMQ